MTNIIKLLNKGVMTLSYEELMDLANYYLELGCDRKDWEQLKKGLRYLHLAINKAEAKGYAALQILKGEQ